MTTLQKQLIGEKSELVDRIDASRRLPESFQILPGSVRLWDDMRDDGNGHIVTPDGSIVATIDYDTGDIYDLS